MKTFIVEYSSEGNQFEGEMVIQSNTLSHAQDRFLTWLKFESHWQHLWQLSFKFREVKMCMLGLPLQTDTKDD
jgi:hypothetical protein